jgi:hypothetical protein
MIEGVLKSFSASPTKSKILSTWELVDTVFTGDTVRPMWGSIEYGLEW